MGVTWCSITCRAACQHIVYLHRHRRSSLFARAHAVGFERTRAYLNARERKGACCFSASQLWLMGAFHFLRNQAVDLMPVVRDDGDILLLSMTQSTLML